MSIPHFLEWLPVEEAVFVWELQNLFERVAHRALWLLQFVSQVLPGFVRYEVGCLQSRTVIICIEGQRASPVLRDRLLVRSRLLVRFAGFLTIAMTGIQDVGDLIKSA